MSSLTAASLDLLLANLSSEPEAASAKYEGLRLKLVKMFLWRSCPESHADDLADRTLDRVAEKLASGEQIDNIQAYALSAARFVWLEHSRRSKEDAVGDEMPERAAEPDTEWADGPDVRLACLRNCLAETIENVDDRKLILEYYSADGGDKNKDVRKRLASHFGISLNTLKVKACRLRTKLESCINECVRRSAVTKVPETDTYNVGRRDNG